MNDTDQTLRNIKIEGYEEYIINELKPFKSELVWISVPTDCSIKLEYNLKNQTKSEIVLGYATSGSGTSMIHLIGGENSHEYQ